MTTLFDSATSPASPHAAGTRVVDAPEAATSEPNRAPRTDGAVASTTSRPRLISHSEASTLLDCQAKHDFAYGSQLVGSSLAPLTTHARLREGRAWGRAMAAWHAKTVVLDPRVSRASIARDAIEASILEDLAAMEIADRQEVDEMAEHLHALLNHYIGTCDPILLDRPEFKLDAPIPGVGGDRFTGHVDGIHVDQGDWIVEFKLRGQLSSLEQITLSRQPRWYAWAWQELTGRPCVGVIVDERLNQAPKPARILASGKVSHAKDQLTTAALYITACGAANDPSHPDVIEALEQRTWQARHQVFYSEAEIAEAGRQLTSVAKLAHLFDTGELYPVRNPNQRNCGMCAYRAICPHPEDAELVDALFARKPPKKDRIEVTA